MLKYKTLDDRQLLIEEIYAELEEILLKKEGNATEEEERNENDNESNINPNFFEEEDNNEKTDERRRLRAIQQLDPSQMTDPQKRKYFYNLLCELEEKKALLENSLTNINTIIQTNRL
ncbi:hypothetical protein M9Y10_011935 [Tritrichomonas musculus]|uniref:Uncharacterized protein n=1 Tax=Tritrichomonas musculus TaxID=1915356 RepID=A0ABR2ICI5_9EUKA